MEQFFNSCLRGLSSGGTHFKEGSTYTIKPILEQNTSVSNTDKHLYQFLKVTSRLTVFNVFENKFCSKLKIKSLYNPSVILDSVVTLTHETGSQRFSGERIPTAIISPTLFYMNLIDVLKSLSTLISNNTLTLEEFSGILNVFDDDLLPKYPLGRRGPSLSTKNQLKPTLLNEYSLRTYLATYLGYYYATEILK